MSEKKATLLQKLLLFTFSCLLILGVFGLAELYFRWFTNINFLDSSKGTFTAKRFGTSYGNTPNFEGISFGEQFYTDKDGFRFDPAFKTIAKEDAPAILMLGDSVLFGPAVTEDKTISGYLRRDLPDFKIYNAGTVGYDTFDYRNVGVSLIPQKSDVKTVYVVYCLNDLISTSSQQIKGQIDKLPGDEVSEGGTPIRSVNDFLRSRSKFYLFLKNALRDTQMIYFQADLLQYQDEETVKKGLHPLVELKKHLEENNISLKIFISPYEVQLRPGSPEEYILPQKQLAQFFQQNEIDFYDMLPDFQKASDGNQKELYLYGDPMHLNAEGNKLISQLIEKDLKNKFSQPQNEIK